jgi:hypothetical protein
MNKTFTASLIAMIVSLSASASDEVWDDYFIGTMSESKNYGNIQILKDTDTCPKALIIGMPTYQTSKAIQYLSINGVDIKVNYYDDSKDEESYFFYPTTNKGTEFLVREFVKKAKVIIKNPKGKEFIFTASGYKTQLKKMFSQCEKNKARLKGAL